MRKLANLIPGHQPIGSGLSSTFEGAGSGGFPASARPQPLASAAAPPAARPVTPVKAAPPAPAAKPPAAPAAPLAGALAQHVKQPAFLASMLGHPALQSFTRPLLAAGGVPLLGLVGDLARGGRNLGTLTRGRPGAGTR